MATYTYKNADKKCIVGMAGGGGGAAVNWLVIFHKVKSTGHCSIDKLPNHTDFSI